MSKIKLTQQILNVEKQIVFRDNLNDWINFYIEDDYISIIVLIESNKGLEMFVLNLIATNKEDINKK